MQYYRQAGATTMTNPFPRNTKTVTMTCPLCGKGQTKIKLEQFSTNCCPHCLAFAVPFIGEPYPKDTVAALSPAKWFFLDDKCFPDPDLVDLREVHWTVTRHDGYRVAWALHKSERPQNWRMQ